MAFVTCGLNHKTAPLELREKIALSAAMHDNSLTHLINLPEVYEAAILSTCNRTEIYAYTENPATLSQWLADTHALPPKSLSPFLYLHQGPQALKHTLRVASGLDSMMVGEPQILGQMKQAYQQACKLGTIKSQLHPLFQYVFSASKRIRNHSGIGANPVSIAYAAVQLIGQLFSKNYQSLHTLIIGSGETSSLVTKYLHQQGVKQFTIASRTQENAQKLAKTWGGKALSIADIPHYLHQVDVVITATSCPLPFITKNLVEYALKERNQSPLFLLDLALPRDIEDAVKTLNHVHLYNLDDLQSLTEKGMDERREAAIKAEQLVEEELTNYLKWHRSFKAKSLICDYRQHMEILAQQELQRAFKKLASGHSEQQVLNEFSTRLVNKLVHTPTKGLQHLAVDNQETLLHLAQYLFTTPYAESL